MFAIRRFRYVDVIFYIFDHYWDEECRSFYRGLVKSRFHCINQTCNIQAQTIQTQEEQSEEMKTFPFPQTLCFRLVPWKRPVFNRKKAIGKSSQIKSKELRIGHWPESCTLLPRCKAVRIIHAFWCRFSPTQPFISMRNVVCESAQKSLVVTWLSLLVACVCRRHRQTNVKCTLQMFPVFYKTLRGGSWGQSQGHLLCHKTPLLFII